MNRYQQTTNYKILGGFLRSKYYNTITNKNIKNANSEQAKNLLRFAKAMNMDMKPGMKDIIVYRGMKNNYYANKTSLVLKAFTSTTTSLKVARSFGPVIIKIKVPPHIKRYVFEYSNKRSNALREDEVLFQRNTKLVNIRYNPTLGMYEANMILYKER